MTQLFTAGYEGKNINSFTVGLLDQNIDAIIDIRENPFSRKPGFSGKALKNYLEYHGIKYLHFQELGTPKPLREFLAESKDYKSFFQRYKEYLPEFGDSLYDILEMGQNKRICIMCFEKDPHFCHRMVVAELLKEYSDTPIAVIHI